MKIIDTRINSLSNDEMAKIFYDVENVPEKLVKNYYFLLADILQTKTIAHNSIIYSALNDCILKLSKRKQIYLSLRYGLNDSIFRTLEEVDLNVSKERVRQFINCILEDLRKQTTVYYIYERFEWLKAEKDDNDITEKLIDEKIKELTEMKEKIASQKKQIDEEFYKYKGIVSNNAVNTSDVSVSILDELNLSVRAYNALMRSGITTYSELMSLTFKDLLKVKGMGKGSAIEVWNKLHQDNLL